DRYIICIVKTRKDATLRMLTMQFAVAAGVPPAKLRNAADTAASTALLGRSCHEFLKACIAAQRIEHRIEPEEGGSIRNAHAQPLRTVSRVVSVKQRWRGRALPCALPLGRGSRSKKPPCKASFSTDNTAMARSDRPNASALSPRHIL